MANPEHNFIGEQRDPGRSCDWVMALGGPTSGVPGSCDDSPHPGAVATLGKKKGKGKN